MIIQGEYCGYRLIGTARSDRNIELLLISTNKIIMHGEHVLS